MAAAAPPPEPFLEAVSTSSPASSPTPTDAAAVEGGDPLPDPSPHITVRAVAVGVAVGGLLCCSNMYFGLQTGWVTMGSLQASLVGFGAFRTLRRCLPAPFTPAEHVVLQSTAVATATLPLAAGFVGILPALARLTPADRPAGPVLLPPAHQLLWAAALAFFGAVFAVPLRRQLVLRERLRFPSGTATARMIQVLHSLPEAPDGASNEGPYGELGKDPGPMDPAVFRRQMQLLWASFAVGGVYQLLTVPLPSLGGLPVFTWVGLPGVTTWRWTLTLSPGYVGQGLIMGPRTTLSMLIGALLGWAVLGPLARTLGWAPGPVGSLSDGASGWVLWLSLALMIAESLTELLLLFLLTLLRHHPVLRRVAVAAAEPVTDPAPFFHRVPAAWWAGGLVVSAMGCVLGVLLTMPDQNLLVLVAAVFLSLLCAALAVRALGETDLNPVSGIGKLAQLLFAAVAPGNVVSNLVAGAIAEAGATQAGDMMQDLKCGHLVGAAPRAQFYGQLVGSFFSIFFTVGAYQLYSYAYTIGEPPLEAPTAAVWLEMARLMNGAPVAAHVLPFGLAFAAYGVLSAVRDKLWPRTARWFPSTMAVAIGMYVAPNWTLPRVLGGIAEGVWRRKSPGTYSRYCIVLASGLVLGEGVLSIVVCIIKAALR